MQTKTFSSFVVTDEQIGSDETGTGDFFVLLLLLPR